MVLHEIVRLPNDDCPRHIPTRRAHRLRTGGTPTSSVRDGGTQPLPPKPGTRTLDLSRRVGLLNDLRKQSPHVEEYLEIPERHRRRLEAHPECVDEA